MGKPVETARQHLKPLSHSFTLDVVFGLQSYQGCHTVSARIESKVGSLYLTPPPDENPSDRVWPVREGQQAATGSGQAGDLYVSGIPAHL